MNEESEDFADGYAVDDPEWLITVRFNVGAVAFDGFLKELVAAELREDEFFKACEPYGRYYVAKKKGDR